MINRCQITSTPIPQEKRNLIQQDNLLKISKQFNTIIKTLLVDYPSHNISTKELLWNHKFFSYMQEINAIVRSAIRYERNFSLETMQVIIRKNNSVAKRYLLALFDLWENINLYCGDDNQTFKKLIKEKLEILLEENNLLVENENNYQVKIEALNTIKYEYPFSYHYQILRLQLNQVDSNYIKDFYQDLDRISKKNISEQEKLFQLNYVLVKFYVQIQTVEEAKLESALKSYLQRLAVLPLKVLVTNGVYQLFKYANDRKNIIFGFTDPKKIEYAEVLANDLLKCESYDQVNLLMEKVAKKYPYRNFPEHSTLYPILNSIEKQARKGNFYEKINKKNSKNKKNENGNCFPTRNAITFYSVINLLRLQVDDESVAIALKELQKLKVYQDYIKTCQDFTKIKNPSLNDEINLHKNLNNFSSYLKETVEKNKKLKNIYLEDAGFLKLYEQTLQPIHLKLQREIVKSEERMKHCDHSNLSLSMQFYKEINIKLNRITTNNYEEKSKLLLRLSTILNEKINVKNGEQPNEDQIKYAQMRASVNQVIKKIDHNYFGTHAFFQGVGMGSRLRNVLAEIDINESNRHAQFQIVRK